jgi:hypothetical protein
VKVKLATATLGAALFLAGVPALASAAPMQSGPIHINQVRISGGTFSDADDSETTILPGMVAISFTNRNAATATDVVFAVESNGYVTKRLNDVGSFSTGTTINHRFPETNPSDGMRVAVARVTFDDGSVWINPEVSDPLVAQSAVNNNVGVVAMRY